jgi:hypothetical protein
MKRQAKAAEGRHRAAYEAGTRGESPGFFDDPAEEQAFQTGREEHSAKRASSAPQGGAAPAGGKPRPPKPAGSAPLFPKAQAGAVKAGGRAGTQAAGVLLGLGAYAVGSNFLEGGMGQVRQWFKAKFLNNAASASAATPNLPADKIPQPGPPGQGGYDPKTGQWLLPNPGGEFGQRAV